MEINLSEETIGVVLSSLKNSKHDLEKLIEKYDFIGKNNEIEINQLKEIKETIKIFENISMEA